MENKVFFFLQKVVLILFERDAPAGRVVVFSYQKTSPLFHFFFASLLPQSEDGNSFY